MCSEQSAAQRSRHRATPWPSSNPPQDEKPHWLSKPGFLALGTLRAYPLTQMRKLCVALRQRTLPLWHPAVQTLVRQAVHHLGELTDAERPQLLWRSDWESDLLPTLCEELAALAEELDSAPREYGSVQLLGELAAALSGWHAPLAAVARRFAAMAARWADELEPSAAREPPARARALRAKQCLLRQTALLCYGAGSALGAGDVLRMLGLAVQIHHGAIYGQGTGLEGDLAQLQVGWLAGAVRAASAFAGCAAACAAAGAVLLL